MATINGTSAKNRLLGTTAADSIYGFGGDDTLYGNTGNDWLDGGLGNDTMFGGFGNDIYVVNSASDVISELANRGIDTVRASINYTLGANVERLLLTGTARNGAGNGLDNTLTGNLQANTLTGFSGNDTLDGGRGADTMRGGFGNDIYIVDEAGDSVFENAGQGIDTVRSFEDYTLRGNFEWLVLEGKALSGTGNALDNRITGNAFGNFLNGLAGNDTIDGGAGGDVMSGGLGNDTYVVDNLLDTAEEFAGQGTDTVRTSVNYGLGAEIENVVLLVGGLNVEGNALANVMNGSAGTDIIEGNDGGDTLNGLGGDDVLFPDSSANPAVLFADIINGGEGIDTVDYGNLNFVAPVNNLGIQINLAAGTSAYGTGGDTYTSIERVIGTAWKDAFLIINGGSAVGGASDDIFQGDFAGATAERFQGDAGNDQFFLYTDVDAGAPHAGDIIVDFVKGQDQLIIDTTNFWTGSNLDKTQPFGGAQLTLNASGLPSGVIVPQFIFETDASRLYFSANGDPASGSILVAEFLGNIGGNLAVTDFVFI